jgi:transposase
MVARQSGTVRYFVRRHADSATCLEVISSTAPEREAMIYTDELRGYDPIADELHLGHASVRHSRTETEPREWARDDDGDGIREVHCHSGEGAGAALRSFLRPFRGVHKKYLHLYVAAYEAMSNAKAISSGIIQRMCFGLKIPQPNET